MEVVSITESSVNFNEGGMHHQSLSLLLQLSTHGKRERPFEAICPYDRLIKIKEMKSMLPYQLADGPA